MHRLAIALILAACSNSRGKPTSPASPSPSVDAPIGVVLPPLGKTAASDPAKATTLAGEALRANDGRGDGHDNGFEAAKAAVLADPGSSLALSRATA